MSRRAARSLDVTGQAGCCSPVVKRCSGPVCRSLCFQLKFGRLLVPPCAECSLSAAAHAGYREPGLRVTTSTIWVSEIWIQDARNWTACLVSSFPE
ncbi:hypothetical protein DPEC_G00297640 [Dallia pectoralis]|uniref:Uncharacterized protein n=1 Tax=Dallia pectoralis TaxID=75939 RepID=A0ACC2FFY2_DALPE|nr:hypothetical protein DPEC_G00297640 [Dallia pectoralis]